MPVTVRNAPAAALRADDVEQFLRPVVPYRDLEADLRATECDSQLRLRAVRHPVARRQSLTIRAHGQRFHLVRPYHVRLLRPVGEAIHAQSAEAA